MSQVAIAVLPHTPLLAPRVGREHRQQLQRTVNACERVATELYALQPAVIVLLTPHGAVVEQTFSCNVAESYQLSLGAFGDLASTQTVPGNPAFAYHLKRLCEDHHFPITLGTARSADYGTAVPALFLKAAWEHASLLPISISDLSLAEHRDFGKILGNAAAASRWRVAIIASVELAHQAASAGADRTKPRSPYDAAVLHAVRRGNFAAITALDERLVADADTCSHPVFAYLAGLLAGRDQEPSFLSYESPFGIGELVAFFPTL